MGAVAAGPDGNPAGGDIGQGEGTTEGSVPGCPPMTYGVPLEGAGFPLVPGETGAEGYSGALPAWGAFAFECKVFPVRSKPAVDGGPAYGQELGPEVLSDEGPEGLVPKQEVDDKAYQGSQDLRTFGPATAIAEGFPDTAYNR